MPESKPSPVVFKSSDDDMSWLFSTEVVAFYAFLQQRNGHLQLSEGNHAFSFYRFMNF